VFAELVDVSGQPMRHAGIWRNKIVVLDPNTVALLTVDLAVLQIQMYLSFTQAQVPDSAVGVLMDPRRFLPTYPTGGCESLIWFQHYPAHLSVLRNTLTRHFDSLIGEIRCYTYVGHLRPPLPKGFFHNSFLAEEFEDVHYYFN
jgi:hypothetical protein